LRSVDEGAPWRLDAAEAAFYQQLADQAGIEVTIRPYDPEERPEPIRAEHIDAVSSDGKVSFIFRSELGCKNKDIERALIRRVMQVDRAQNVRGR
jgi:hypothetical protein